ncbi:hypothetical protein Kole_0732 [Kosmotoga olearia TBF 19.5.1]|uniref:Uncharacterized protein n=1 Tax=Kosmotoga olearia (strain ATCC BAA-1733 / DSM 21960 / TBF 19.5.1) TaxID=521045 RepID=C5CFM8_KOSOT|nr:hypothetical protein Kole_0732 [Kosmotoga olearia TBF 19.5.1]
MTLARLSADGATFVKAVRCYAAAVLSFAQAMRDFVTAMRNGVAAKYIKKRDWMLETGESCCAATKTLSVVGCRLCVKNFLKRAGLGFRKRDVQRTTNNGFSRISGLGFSVLGRYVQRTTYNGKSERREIP